jgi:hypothetical protein
VERAEAVILYYVLPDHAVVTDVEATDVPRDHEMVRIKLGDTPERTFWVASVAWALEVRGSNVVTRVTVSLSAEP